MLISVDQNGVYRIHKLKGVALMTDKNFLLTDEDFDGGADPCRITNLK